MRTLKNKLKHAHSQEDGQGVYIGGGALMVILLIVVILLLI